jgi:hypothetical protein
MRITGTIPILVLASILCTGCMSKYVGQDRMLDQVNVFGVRLYSDVDYREINGVPATEEPCIKGYDRSFNALDITVGYGFDKRIRKIITRNPGTGMFGISPGMSLEEGRGKVLQAGFNEWAPPYKFKTRNYSLAFLVDDDGRIFGMILESLD